MDRRPYKKEFKDEAVKLSHRNGVCKTATELGINQNMLSRWRREQNHDGKDAFRGHGKLRAEEAELEQLRRENKSLKEERDILKKALAIFSQPQK